MGPLFLTPIQIASLDLRSSLPPKRILLLCLCFWSASLTWYVLQHSTIGGPLGGWLIWPGACTRTLAVCPTSSRLCRTLGAGEWTIAGLADDQVVGNFWCHIAFYAVRGLGPNLKPNPISKSITHKFMIYITLMWLINV